MCKRVQILMSVYNGEKYLSEQLDSLAAQTECDISLLIRDDASTDGSAGIIRQYQEKYPWIVYYKGENKGACGSFLDLSAHADMDADYYAFCDQDDVWEPDKLKCAIEMLEQQPVRECLYCSPVKLVDAGLVPISDISQYPALKASFGNAVVENICTGCTAVFSRELLLLIREKLPQHAYMHDWWLYLVAACFGVVCYDTDSHILYRQHGNNTLGGQESFVSHLKRRMRNYGGMKHYVPEQLAEFLQLYGGDISGENRKVLETMLMPQKNPFSRCRIFRQKAVMRSRRMDDIIYKILFLFWRFGK